MRAAFCTLGCKVNQYETEALAACFSKEGYTLVQPSEEAEVYVVSSCTVTGESDRKTRQLLRQLRRRNPGAVIALTGCYPQAFPQEAAAVSEADIVRGARERGTLPQEAKEVWEAKRRGEQARLVRIPPHEAGEPFEPMAVEGLSGHTRAFLKIEDGCDRYCAYCVIPRARGPVRSKPLSELEEEVRVLTENGYREIVLVGINLSSYGRETGDRLADAVERVCGVEGVMRLRLGSLEPELLTDEDLRRMAGQEKFCPQFHLSLQSGCEATLRRMNRHYTPGEYLSLAERIRGSFPLAAVTTDVMVGFPGETEEEFAQSLAFVESVGFAKAHVFPYSVRPGTRAASMEGQVPPGEKERRVGEMLAVAARSREAFFSGQIGTEQQVLFETLREDGGYTGYTKNYTPVEVFCAFDPRGRILPVRIEEASPEGCRGTIAGAFAPKPPA